MTLAMLMSADSFESFFGHVLKLDREKFLNSYRNDWSWYYAKGLLDNGIEPILYVPSLHESGLHETDTGIRVRFLPLARWYVPLAKFRRACRATRWSLYAQERLNALAFIEPLRTAIADDGVDLLYLQEYWNGRFDHLVHHVDVPVTAADHGGLSAGVVKWFKRSAFARASTIYGQTADECDCVKSYGGDATLHSNGCDTDFFFPDPTVVRTKSILTVARLTDKQKRTSDLIRSLKRLDEAWSLDIVGTGPDEQNLRELAKSTGVASRVRFQGFKGRDAVRDFARRCGVYAMPSSNEAICLAVLEAMACGAAVVATEIRAFESMIDDGVNGRLVPVGDPAALAVAIEQAWQQREQFGAAATDTVKKRFSAEVLYRNLAESLRAAAVGRNDSGLPNGLRTGAAA